MSTPSGTRPPRFPRITPFLWYVDQAEQAAELYVSIFEDSRICYTTRYEENGARMTGRAIGSIMTVAFELDGQAFVALNGGPHDTFNDSISLCVNCQTQQEIDYYWNRLSDGGRIVQCGWLKDRFGVSWQIVPAELDPMLAEADPESAGRIMKAMLDMVKLDLSALREAASRSKT